MDGEEPRLRARHDKGVWQAARQERHRSRACGPHRPVHLDTQLTVEHQKRLVGGVVAVYRAAVARLGLVILDRQLPTSGIAAGPHPDQRSEEPDGPLDVRGQDRRRAWHRVRPARLAGRRPDHDLAGRTGTRNAIGVSPRAQPRPAASQLRLTVTFARPAWNGITGLRWARLWKISDASNRRPDLTRSAGRQIATLTWTQSSGLPFLRCGA
jgi:hypothetical protein